MLAMFHSFNTQLIQTFPALVFNKLTQGSVPQEDKTLTFYLSSKYSTNDQRGESYSLNRVELYLTINLLKMCKEGVNR
jgi:hypothetical protein